MYGHRAAFMKPEHIKDRGSRHRLGSDVFHLHFFDDISQSTFLIDTVIGRARQVGRNVVFWQIPHRTRSRQFQCTFRSLGLSVGGGVLAFPPLALSRLPLLCARV